MFSSSAKLFYRIMRNGTVNTTILVFACLGVLKSVVTVGLVFGAFEAVSEWLSKITPLPEYPGPPPLRLVPIKQQNRYIVCGGSQKIVTIPPHPDNSESLAAVRAAHANNSAVLKMTNAGNVAQFKPLIAIVGWLLSDAAEMLLLYFYVEKYLTNRVPIVFIKSLLLAVVATVLVLLELLKIGPSIDRLEVYAGKRRRAVALAALLSVPVLAATLASVVRAYLACHQAFQATLFAECFAVREGALLQVPFQCLSGLEYLFLGCVGVGVVSAAVCVAAAVVYIMCRESTAEQFTTQQQQGEVI